MTCRSSRSLAGSVPCYWDHQRRPTLVVQSDEHPSSERPQPVIEVDITFEWLSALFTSIRSKGGLNY